jgi:hypothetical protein
VPWLCISKNMRIFDGGKKNVVIREQLRMLHIHIRIITIQIYE